MKTLDAKSVSLESVIVDGVPVLRVKPRASMKKMSLRPRKSLSRVKSLRPLKAAGKQVESQLTDLD